MSIFTDAEESNAAKVASLVFTFAERVLVLAAIGLAARYSVSEVSAAILRIIVYAMMLVLGWWLNQYTFPIVARFAHSEAAKPNMYTRILKVGSFVLITLIALFIGTLITLVIEEVISSTRA